MSAAAEQEIAALIERHRAPGDGIAWARPSGLHLTLKFLGPAIDSNLVPPLIGALSRTAIEVQPFEVRVHGLGGFPNLRRPRVIWIGVTSAELSTLAGRVSDAASECGFDRERRPWSAHLTLGRVREPRRIGGALTALQADKDCDFGISYVDRMFLYQSHLSPKELRTKFWR